MLHGRQGAIFDERRQKLEQAQENRKRQRSQPDFFFEPITTITRSEEQSQGRARAFCGRSEG